jgi:4-amino-4-deoxy-L-arabinose transferase-like glycosyltransferase
VPIARYILILIFAIWIFLFIVYRKKIKECKIVIPLLCIATVPYIWYIIFAGHSSIHCWFTNKIQAMSAFAVLCAMFETIDTQNIGKYIKKDRRNKNENSRINTML